MFITVDLLQQMNQKLGQENNVIADCTGDLPLHHVDGLRRDINSTALAYGVINSVDMVLGTTADDQLDLQLVMPMAGKAAVCKGVEVVHKLGQRDLIGVNHFFLHCVVRVQM